MALASFSFLTAKGSVRMRFDDGVSVEVLGHYFTLDIGVPLAVSVSDGYLLFVLDKEGDNLCAYTLMGDYAFSLADLGLDATLIGGSVMSAPEAIRFLSRYPDVKVAQDHTYYLATTNEYKMLLVDLDTKEIAFRT